VGTRKPHVSAVSWQDPTVTCRFRWTPVLLCLLWPAATRAEDAAEAPTAPTAEAEGPTAPRAESSVVVFCDVLDDETENAKLRARVYEVTRQKGLTPDPKADVAAAAQAKGALDEGRVTSDADRLEVVRATLGVGVLVRVAREGSGAKIVVARASGSKSKVVGSAEAVPDAVAALIGGKSVASATSSATESHAAAADDGTITAGLMLRPKRDDSEKDMTDPKQLSAAWQKRSGLRGSYGVHAVVTGLAIPKTPYVGQNPETGAAELGRATTYGVGAGLGLDLSMMYAPVPEPVTGSTNFAAFRLGVRLDVSGLYVRPPKNFSYQTTNGSVTGRDTKYDNVANIYGVLPIQAGVHFAFGDFRLPTLWRGIMLGVAYSPAWIFSLKVGEKENATDSKFNYAGFELSLDVAKFDVEEGSQPQIRVSALVLPRVADDLPWLASAGIGAIWY
jgi:hypothetical protein